MRQGTKRSLALLLCLVLLGTLLPALPAQAEEIGIIPVEDPAEAGPVGGDEIVLIEEPAEPLAGEPTIAEQPQSRTAELDETVRFTVEATGAETYQWYYRKSAAGDWLETTLSGCTTATLKVVAKSTRDGWQFRCKVSNSSGYVYSGAATLTLKKETPTEKPVIVTQPASVSVKEETSARFTVEATGAESYQWYYRKNSDASWAETTLSGCTTATLTVLAKSTRDGWQFRCKVSNRIGYVYTKAVTLTLLQKPAITAQPANRTVSEGDTAKFTVKATGAESYQWYWRSSSSGSWAKSSLTGNQTATLSVVGKTSRNGYQYRCKVSNSSGYVYTSAATLTVTAKPVITTQPSDRTVNQSDTAKFTVKATGAESYQWYYRTSSSGTWAKSTLSTATTATLSVKGTAARDGYQYRCKVSNDYGYVYSKAVTLTVNTLPVITKQPTDLTISAGGNAFFSLEATNADSYQWYWRKNSSSDWAECTVAGATTARLGYGSVGYSSDGYQYRCKVSNSIGYVYSDTVTLTVAHIQPEITTQPSSVTAEEGAAARFTVKATGGGLSYQWYWRSSSSSEWSESTQTGAKTATLIYSSTSTFMNGRQFRCKVSNDIGTVYTNTVTLSFKQVTPTITTQPTSLTVTEGDPVSLSVKAAGGCLKYQWYWRISSSDDWKESTASGAKSATLSYEEAKLAMNGRQLRCKVSNDVGTVYTDTVTLTVEKSKPKVTTQPKSLTVNEGDKASFSIEAKYADSYQWYYMEGSSGSWKEVGAATRDNMTLRSVSASWDGYRFACKVTNSAGVTWSYAAVLTVNPLPHIKHQPKNAAINAGDSVTFTVVADYVDNYQWYWRPNAATDWIGLTGNAASISFSNIDSSWNGRQFRCMLSNDAGSVYTEYAAITINDSVVRYRALLVGEVHFSSEDVATRNQGDVNLMADMLGSVTGPAGGSYAITTKIDLSRSELRTAILDTFAGADNNDVSLFFLATHGVVDVSSGEEAGALTLLASKYHKESMKLAELAECLSNVPGKVIVILGSCGSGAAIVENGGDGMDVGFDAAAFNESAIGAFAALDPLPNTGEFRSTKFYVLTAAAHQEYSWGYSDNSCNYFTNFITKGCGSGKPADSNNNGTITLGELYRYVYDNCVAKAHHVDDDPTDYYQHVQVYPENSSYALFK